MNIAFCFTWLFNPHVGGTERVTDLLAKEFAKRGHEIHYIYTVARDTDQLFENPAHKTHFIPESEFLSEAGKQKYLRYIDENKIDIVINQGGVMGTCKRFASVPPSCKSVTVIHFDPSYGLSSLFMELMQLRNNSFVEKLKRIYRFFDYYNRKKKLRTYLRELYEYWGETSEKVVLLSNSFKNTFMNICPDFPEKKLTSIPNPLSFPINRSVAKRENTILWVGRMDFRQKRPDLMIKIWAKAHSRLPEWNLIMLGDGKAFQEVKNMAKGLPRIEFPGQQVSLPYFQRARICSSSSSSSSEGWGMVLTEAASQGAVPMAFDSYESVRDILSDELQLITPYSIDEYVDKMVSIATSPSLLESLRQKNYAMAERYNIETVADCWEALFEEIR